MTIGSIKIIANKKTFFITNIWDSYPSFLGNHLVSEIIEINQKYTNEELKNLFKNIQIVKGIQPSRIVSSDWGSIDQECLISVKEMLENGIIYDQKHQEPDYFYVIDWDKKNFSILGNQKKIYKFENLKKDMFY